jgi:hypothetical protein
MYEWPEDATVGLPGHGEVTDTRQIREVREYLDYIRTETRRLRTDGVSVADAAATIAQHAQTRWSTWETPHWISFTVSALYEEPLTRHCQRRQRLPRSTADPRLLDRDSSDLGAADGWVRSELGPLTAHREPASTEVITTVATRTALRRDPQRPVSVPPLLA